MAFVYTEQDNGELLVEEVSKGVHQVVPDIPRPYFLIYLPDNNNVYGVSELSSWEDEDYIFLKVVF